MWSWKVQVLVKTTLWKRLLFKLSLNIYWFSYHNLLSLYYYSCSMKIWKNLAHVVDIGILEMIKTTARCRCCAEYDFAGTCADLCGVVICRCPRVRRTWLLFQPVSCQRRTWNVIETQTTVSSTSLRYIIKICTLIYYVSFLV